VLSAAWASTPSIPGDLLPAVKDPDPAIPAHPDLESHRIGLYETGRPGPRVIIVGGMHGNEPGGVLALQRVLAELEELRLPLRGRLLCLGGNLEALRRGQRFIDRDLNRVWGYGQEVPEGPGIYEFEVRDRLQAEIEPVLEGATEPVVFLDLHSTSAGGAPFSIIGDTRQNRRIALGLPVPVILGLEESVDGALLGYFGERGHIAVGFEGGQHDDPLTVDHHEAAVWITLIRAGALLREEVPRAVEFYDRLREGARGRPGVIEMRHRHHVRAEDEFSMREGFANFDPIARGDVLATDASGQVTSPESGLLLLPLYQGQGQDGFFVGREVRRFWLRVSTAMRALRLGELVHWMPGVSRVEGATPTVEVRPSVARWWVVEIFHLLGFRRVRAVEGRLRFSRRVEGLP